MADTLPVTAWSEHATTLDAPGWAIPAALTVPTSDDGHVASAILLVPGSLSCDVNGDFPAWNSFPHVYAHLARQLSARGHVVYRFAKLGPGTGSTMTDERAASRVKSWDGRLTIALAALDAMRRELHAHGITPARLIVAGHSEGAVVASRVATSDRGRALDGVVLLAGPSVGILDIMREQAWSMSPPDLRDDAVRRLDVVIGHVRRGESIPEGVAGAGQTGAAALAAMPADARRYMGDCDATDPCALAAQMTQPVLVVQGGDDSSVPPHHAEALLDALRGRSEGGALTDSLFVPGLSHMFKLVPPDLDPMAAFGYPGETDVRVADGVDAWIRRGRNEPGVDAE